MGLIRRLSIAALFCLPAPLLAAGGTHVLDDYGVETPGVCNSELFGTHYAKRVNRGTATLNCTFEAAPMLEWGLAATHLDEDGSPQTLLGPSVKWRLAEPGAGPGIAISAAVKFGAESGRLEDAAILVPLSFALKPGVLFSVNAGWLHSRLAKPRDTAKLGAQIAADVADGLQLMGEGFSTLEGPAGAQAGVRWTPGGGRPDFDLTLGRKIDGVSDFSVSAGLIARF